MRKLAEGLGLTVQEVKEYLDEYEGE